VSRRVGIKTIGSVVGSPSLKCEDVLACLYEDYYYWLCLFESLDGFTKDIGAGGSITVDGLIVSLQTGATINTIVGISKTPNWCTSDFTWNKRRKFKTRIYLESATKQTLWVISGSKDTSCHVGFKVVDNKLYGTVADGTSESTVELLTIQAGYDYILECLFTPEEKCVFTVKYCSSWVNSACVEAEVTKEVITNLPSEASDSAKIINVNLKNTEAANKRVDLSCWEFYYRRPSEKLY